MFHDASAQLFLKQAATAALTGRSVPLEEMSGRPIATVLPLHARDFLNALPTLPSLDQTSREPGSLLRPQRGLADYFSGTWLVPR